MQTDPNEPGKTTPATPDTTAPDETQSPVDDPSAPAPGAEPDPMKPGEGSTVDTESPLGGQDTEEHVNLVEGDDPGPTVAFNPTEGDGDVHEQDFEEVMPPTIPAESWVGDPDDEHGADDHPRDSGEVSS